MYVTFGVFAVTGAAFAGAAGAAFGFAGGRTATPPVPFANALEAPAAESIRLHRTAPQLRVHTTTTSFVGLRG
ncbi:MAG TPA: hypothetical protein VKV16_10285 [Solirubrobacteraceae bacterium]|nr:hypothetical protein [Solirubrobacteraceae bacterium]